MLCWQCQLPNVIVAYKRSEKVKWKGKKHAQFSKIIEMKLIGVERIVSKAGSMFVATVGYADLDGDNFDGSEEDEVQHNT